MRCTRGRRSRLHLIKVGLNHGQKSTAEWRQKVAFDMWRGFIKFSHRCLQLSVLRLGFIGDTWVGVYETSSR